MSITILLADDEENTRINLGGLLTTKGYDVLTAATLEEARGHIQKGEGDVVLLDLQLPDGYGPNLLIEMANMPNRPPVIMITGYGDIESAVDAMKNGAMDFLSKPVDFAQLEKSIKRAVDYVSMKRELEHLRREQMRDAEFVVGSSQVMKDAVELAGKAALKKANVLIIGETGTGKDVLAQYIYSTGQRKPNSYIAINCAAIQNTMLESELFGHEAGAFTTAMKRKLGQMELADGGVLFLDEISSMSLDLQAKLLRSIENKTFKRVGGEHDVTVDIQVVSASNRDLPTLIKEGKFREDLYYRLRVVEIVLPPLRERIEDIPDLVGYFVRKYNMKNGVNVQSVAPEAIEALQQYRWPGNIRELSNAIERAMIFCDGEKIELKDLPKDVVAKAE